MKISKKIALLYIILSMGIVLSGCGRKPITLKEAIKNTKEVKSGTSYVRVSMMSENENLEMPMKAIIEVNGDFKNESKEKGKFDGYINLRMIDMDMQFNIPIKTNIKNPEDVDVFIGLPLMYKNLLGIEEDKDMVYINTKELKNISAEENNNGEINIKTYEKISKEFYRIFNNFKADNKTVLTFKEIKNKPIKSNGIYEITFTDENLKSFIVKLLQDKNFVKSLKELYPSIESDENFIQEEIGEVIQNIDNLNDIYISGEIKIQDEIISSMRFSFLDKTNEKNQEMTMSIEYSNINKKVNINIPNKDDDNVFNLNEKIKEQKEIRKYYD